MMRRSLCTLLKEKGYEPIDNVQNLSPYKSRRYIKSIHGGILPLLALTPDECRDWLKCSND